MDSVHSIKNISELNQLLNQDKTKHPLLSVVDFSKVEHYGKEEGRMSADFYTLMFKSHCHNKIKYGREFYDFQEGTLICIAPNQVITLEKEDGNNKDAIGWGLFFHPDLLRGTALGARMKDFTFFSYEMNEALHLSDKEKQNLAEIVAKIESELNENIDQHSQVLLVNTLELLLNYCARYYDRQFITRKNTNSTVLSKFENILTEYFASGNLKENGLPSVKYCADKIFLSPNYLSDLLKKETGKNSQELIHYQLIELAKNTLLSTDLPVSQIAYDLGFEYPQYFSKLFKNKTGMTPGEFRSLN
ncbi:MAG: helix-turn-helix domain-containing protein [Fluviicola sp.]